MMTYFIATGGMNVPVVAENPMGAVQKFLDYLKEQNAAVTLGTLISISPVQVDAEEADETLYTSTEKVLEGRGELVYVAEEDPAHLMPDYDFEGSRR